MGSTLSTAGQSVRHYRQLVRQHALHMRRNRLGSLYDVESGRYAIFRETVCPTASGQAVVLVVGFRLRLLRSSRLLHWCFQRVCLLTTPFWSGLPGFKVKLWMVDPSTHNYLGIYDWRGPAEAQAYLAYLLPILDFFSVGGSVWAQQLQGVEFEQYLVQHSGPHSLDNLVGLGSEPAKSLLRG